MEDTSRGYLLVLSAVVLWGTQGVLGKAVMNTGVNPQALAAIRILLAALMFGLTLLIRDPSGLKIRRQDIPFFLGYGILTVTLLHGSFNLAVYHTGVATASILLYTAPAFVTLMSIFVFRERPSVPQILALLLTLAGCLVITLNPGEIEINRTGVFFGLLTGFSYGLWKVLSKKGLDRYRPDTLNFVSMTIGGFFLILWSLTSGGVRNFSLPPGTWVVILLMALVNSFLPNRFFINGLKRMQASRASILTNFELVISVLLARIIFQEPFTPAKLLGFALIITGIILIAREDLRSRSA